MNTSSHKFASLSVIFISIGVALNVVCQAFMLSTADAASKGDMIVAGNMLAGYLGLNPISVITLFIGITLMGLSLYLEKSLNSLILGLLIIISIIEVVIPLWDSRSSLLFIPFIGLFISSIIIGRLTIKRKQ